MDKTDKAIKTTGVIILILGVGLGFLYLYPPTWWLGGVINSFYTNLSTELISIAITILLINYLYEKKEEKNTKRRLIRELGSEDKGFSSRAVKELCEKKWLYDGSVNGCDLSNANLSGLNLSKAKLKNVNLTDANLTGTIFKDADLSGAIIKDALLVNANLAKCKLEGVKMINCNLYKANLNGVVVNNNADLMNSNFELAEFIDAEISDTRMEDAHLNYAQFVRVKVTNTNFLRADFLNLNIDNAIFERCDFNSLKNWKETMNYSSAKFQGIINPPDNCIEFFNGEPVEPEN